MRDVWLVWDIEEEAYIADGQFLNVYTHDLKKARWFTFAKAMLVARNRSTMKEEYVAAVPVHIDAAEHGFASPHFNPDGSSK